MHAFLFTCRALLSSTWLAAGASKLGGDHQGGSEGADPGLLPSRAVRVVVGVLPWLEITLGLLVIAGWPQRLAAWLSAALLCVFTVAIIANLIAGRQVECNCFGQARRTRISWLSVLRNAVLLSAALTIAAYGGASRTVPVLQIEQAPLALAALAGWLLHSLAGAALDVGDAVVRADGGPALGLPERRFLARWLQPPIGRAATPDEG